MHLKRVLTQHSYAYFVEIKKKNENDNNKVVLPHLSKNLR